MNKKYFQCLTIIFIFLFTCGMVSAAPATTAWSGTLLVILQNITDKIFTVVGIICLLVLLIGGIVWMTAGGDTEKVKKAKEIIIAAVLGLVVILGAKIIMSEVSNLGM